MDARVEMPVTQENVQVVANVIPLAKLTPAPCGPIVVTTPVTTSIV